MITLRDVDRLLKPIRTQVANMVSRAVVTAIKETTKFQELELTLLDGETRTGLERFQNYGFTSFPRKPSSAGAPEAVVVFPTGRRDHGLVVAVDDRRFRITSLQEGEVAIYTDQGDRMVFKRGGTIEITASTLVKVIGKLEVTGDVKLDAKLEVVGDSKLDAKLDVTGKISGSDSITATGEVTGNGIELSTHTHKVKGDGLTDSGVAGGTVGGTATSDAPS